MNRKNKHVPTWKECCRGAGWLWTMILCVSLFSASAFSSGEKRETSRFATDISQSQVAWFTVSSGGMSHQVSTNYQAGITVGQPVSGTGQSANYKASLGFWYKDLGLPTSVEEVPADQLPGSFSLSQNYPNPFNPSTTIDFAVPKKGNVRIVVYNLLGQQVITLLDQPMSAGVYRAVWDGCNEAGHQVASGIYFYRMEADNFVATKKMVLLK